MLLISALGFILVTVSTHHLTEKWDRSIKQHSLDLSSTFPQYCTSVHLQTLKLIL